MDSPFVSLPRSTCLQLGAVAAIGVATVASGGTLVPLFASVLGGVGAKVAGDAIVGLIPNILSGLFSDKVKGDQQRAEKAHRSKQNHDIQKVISKAVAKCLRMASASYPTGVEPPEYLVAVATSIERDPLSLVIEVHESLNQQISTEIDEKAITSILSGDIASILARNVLTSEQWTELLRRAGIATHSLSPTQNVTKGVEFCKEHFTRQLVQVLKEAGAESDPAWFAVALRLLCEVHAGVHEIKGDLKAQSAAITALQQAFQVHAEAIKNAFAAIPSGCDPTELAAIRRIATAFSTDIPEMKAALEKTEELARVAAEQATLAAASSARIVEMLEPLNRLVRRLAEQSDTAMAMGFVSVVDASVAKNSIGRMLSSSSPVQILNGLSELNVISVKGVPVEALEHAMREVNWAALLSIDESLIEDLVVIVVGCLSGLPSRSKAICLASLGAALQERRTTRQAVMFVRQLATTDIDSLRALALPTEWFVGNRHEDRFNAMQRFQSQRLLAGNDGNLFRVGLDLWPGYFPLFSLQDQFDKQGIAITNVESSRDKVRMLRSGQLDIIGTTPGCLLGPNGAPQADLRVVAVLNRSYGSDKVLYSGPRGEPRLDASTCWIVTHGSTAELLALEYARIIEGRAPRSETWIRARGYDHAHELMQKAVGPVVCSTWEPYASWLMDALPDVRVLFSTKECRPLVIDCLACHRGRSWHAIRQSLNALLDAWDLAVSDEQHKQAHIMAGLAGRGVQFDAEACAAMADGVEFFTTKQASKLAASGFFEKVAESVGQLWRLGDARNVWNSLVSPPTQWLPRSSETS